MGKLIMFDFNGAGPQGPTREERLEAVTLECRFRTLEVLHYLLPGGRINGREYEAADIGGMRGNSLKYNLDSGQWADFAANDKGGDLIGLWKACRGVSFKETVREMEEFFSCAPHEVKTPKAERDPLPPPTKTWNYLDAGGKIIATVTRYDMPDGKKEFRPWDAIARKATHPEVRPLYNIPGIVQARRVVIVEGEKCADALIRLGVCATTAMGGSNTLIEKTDWAPLVGKQLIVWPDNDEPGKKYAAALQRQWPAAKVLEVPAGKPAKWDAADAVVEGFDVVALIASALPKDSFATANFEDHTVSRFTSKPAPPIKWLLTGSLRQGTLGLLAGAGGVGKSYLLLQLACMIASGAKTLDEIFIPGTTGKVVCLFGEDDEVTIHHRIEAIVNVWGLPVWAGVDFNQTQTADGFIDKINSNLCVFTGSGQDWRLLKKQGANPEPTQRVEELIFFMSRIEELKLVIVDPLSRFFGAEENDNTSGTLFCEQLERIAQETGAAVICSHHVNKDSRQEGKDTLDVNSLRGASAFANGARWVCVIADKKLSKEDREKGDIVKGKVVKKNFGKPEKTFYLRRDQGGILRQHEYKEKEKTDEEKELLERIKNFISGLESKGKKATLRQLWRNHYIDLDASTLKVKEAAERAIVNDQLFEIVDKNSTGKQTIYLGLTPQGTPQEINTATPQDTAENDPCGVEVE